MDGSVSRVWVDDRNAIFRRGLMSCLDGGGFQVAGESAGLQPMPAFTSVDILLFEVEEGGLQHALRTMNGGCERVRLVGLARMANEETLYDAVEAGLAGLLIRAELTPDGLTACLRAVVAGAGAMPPKLLARLVEGLAKGGKPTGTAGQLAAREVRVLSLLADGGDTRDIATRLSYSERTVKNIVHDVLMKMNCRTRAQAVAVATRQGVI